MVRQLLISSLTTVGLFGFGIPSQAEILVGEPLEEPNQEQTDEGKPPQQEQGQDQDQDDGQQQQMQGVILKVKIDNAGQEQGDSAELRVHMGDQPASDQGDLEKIWKQSKPIEQVAQNPNALAEDDSKMQRPWWNSYRYRGWYRPYHYYYNYYPYYGNYWRYPYYSNNYWYPYGYRYYYWPYY